MVPKFWLVEVQYLPILSFHTWQNWRQIHGKDVSNRIGLKIYSSPIFSCQTHQTPWFPVNATFNESIECPQEYQLIVPEMVEGYEKLYVYTTYR